MSHDGFDRTLLRAFADEIAEHARDGLVHDPTGAAYPASAYGIYLDTWPLIAGPSLTLAAYDVDNAFALADSTIGVQVTIRDKDRRRIGRVSDDVFARFQGRHGGMLGPIDLVSARRASATNLGQDANGRLGRSENYYLTVHRPTPHRT